MLADIGFERFRGVDINLVGLKLVLDSKGTVALITLNPLLVVVADVALLAFLVKEPLVTKRALLQNAWVELQEVTADHQRRVVHDLEANGAG